MGRRPAPSRAVARIRAEPRFVRPNSESGLAASALEAPSRKSGNLVSATPRLANYGDLIERKRLDCLTHSAWPVDLDRHRRGAFPDSQVDRP